MEASMGRALASIVEQVDAAKRTDALAPLLDPDAHEMPPEPDVRTLLEAADLDADAAIAAARGDGDIFEGDEVADEPLQAATVRLVVAVGAGYPVAGAQLTRRYKAVIIRPGRAKGAGRRYYGRRMLEANAGNFGGVNVYFNHEDLATIMRRGHGSRDPRDVAGRLQESTWWESSYTEPDDAKHGRKAGAVMGHVDLLVEAADRVDALPDAFALSICMESPRIRVGRTDEGDLAPLVEGIVPQSGSVDLITAGADGAGGRLLARLREAAESRYGSANVDLGAIDDTRLIEAARARPDVLAALRQDHHPPPDPEDDDVTDPAKLIEAVQGDADVAAKLAEALAGTPAFDRLVEAKVADREEEIREDAKADSDRALALRDFRDEATRLIEARSAGKGGILTPAYVEDLRERYTLRDGTPAPALDVYDELDDQGAVRKPALERLREAVEADVKREEAKLRESQPTRVRDLAAPAPTTGDDGGEPPPPAKRIDPMAERLGLDADKVRAYQEA
jgi:hypothetical protein